jgi:hypothetical protein
MIIGSYKQHIAAKHIILCCCILFLSACETVRYLKIETLQPAAVTFPLEFPAVVIVNNMAVQPPESGILFKTNGYATVNQMLQKDSASQKFLESFESLLTRAACFRSVSIYSTPLRDDGDFLSIKEIPAKRIWKIAEETYADVILSVDRLLFNVSQNVYAGSSYIHDNAGVVALLAGKADLGVYVHGRKDTVHFIDLVDTRRIQRYVLAESLGIYRDLPETLLGDVAQALAQGAVYHFAPHWMMQDRVLYTGADSGMKMAYAYSQKDQWNVASFIWQEVYNSERGYKKKGMIAINIALSEEMSDRYSSALEWVDKALSMYARESASKVKEETVYAGKYRKILEKRITQ